MNRALMVTTGALLALVVLAASATAAMAAPAIRYASPKGTGTACTNTAPCSLRQAIQQAPIGTSTVNARGDLGDYQVSSRISTAANQDVQVHGVRGRPRLIAHGSEALQLFGATSSVEHFYVETLNPKTTEDSANGFALVNGGTANDVIAVARAGGGVACFFRASTITNSVCWAPGSAGAAIRFFENIAPHTDTLRNVTAVGGSGGEGVSLYAEGVASTLNVTNVITHTPAGGTDLYTATDSTAGSDATINTSHVNYATHAATGLGANDTLPNSSDQSAKPLFVDAVHGDFHEASGSPTIDHGVNSALNGAFDFDGDARRIGAATDIGADEFLPPFKGVKVVSKSAKVKSKHAKISLSCPTPIRGACAGKLTLVHGKGKHKVKLGTKRFTLVAGKTGEVSVKISKAGLDLLKQGSLSARATVVAHDGRNLKRTTHHKVTLKLA